MIEGMRRLTASGIEDNNKFQSSIGHAEKKPEDTKTQKKSHKKKPSKMLFPTCDFVSLWLDVLKSAP
jgi:hypothetical protein